MAQMTPEQALSIITSRPCDNCAWAGCVGLLYESEPICDAKIAITVAVDTLKKQVPQKPEWVDVKRRNSKGSHYIGRAQICPVCKKRIGAAKVQYCGCGQRLDWEG